MINDVRVNNINNHYSDLNSIIALNNNNLQNNLNSNRIIFDSQSHRLSNNNILLNNPNANQNNIINNNNNTNSERTNNINLNNFDRGSNNMINISINDEISSRRLNNNNYNNNNNNNRDQIGLNAGLNSRIEVTNINSLGNRNLDCQLCRECFVNERDYDMHMLTCRDFRNNRMLHNINEILQLVQSINRHFQFEGRLNSLGLLGLDEPEDALEFIDWKYDKKIELWKNEGKINITSKVFYFLKKN